MNKAISIIIVLFFLSCGAPAKKHDIINYANFESDFDPVWSAVIQFFATNSIAIKTIEKASGIIYAEPQIFPMSWVDCGKPYLLEIFKEPESSFNVLVKNEDGEIFVQITANFQTQVFVSGRFQEYRSCYSTGIFENLLLEYIEDNR